MLSKKSVTIHDLAPDHTPLESFFYGFEDDGLGTAWPPHWRHAVMGSDDYDFRHAKLYPLAEPVAAVPNVVGNQPFNLASDWRDCGNGYRYRILYTSKDER